MFESWIATAIRNMEFNDRIEDWKTNIPRNPDKSTFVHFQMSVNGKCLTEAKAEGI
ncbi:hypothetical protein [Bacillus changyiensis]|uniref:hypothetical protein n=1 Tax=Bacillus changyiensis TaxID=3004103 RepID=UPI0022E5CE36|nr:hypothetical protein [Bacillus changyiensis]MDA1478432.1 hypothetical protein [Bacillus changyiensis]